MTRAVVERVATGTSLALGVAVLVVVDRALPTGFLAWGAALALALVAAWELSAMGSLAERRLGLPLALGTLVAALLAAAFLVPASPWSRWVRAEPPFVLVVALGAAAAIVAGTVGRLRSGGSDDLAWTVGAALWCTAPLFGLVAVDVRWGTAGLVALVVTTKVGDVFAYFVGRAIGRRHPFPRLSPGKTVAGCVASLVAAVAVGALLAFCALPGGGAGWLAGAASGLGLNLAAQGGDLFESWVKRRAGVKDSSTLVGPAGGVLDVLDSLLFGVPVALLLWPSLFPATGAG